jgi:23S rRNA (pseudouridine1915-N3)-methyltransferase
MHPIEVVAFGKLRLAPLRDLEKHYLDMLRTCARMEVTELSEGRSDVARALKEEADRLRPRIQASSCPVLLSPEGKHHSSEAFATWLGQRLDRGDRPCFIIGSSHGFDPALKAEVKAQLSLSPMTFPHELSRVLLLEQLYRAFQILRGGPYHK